MTPRRALCSAGRARCAPDSNVLTVRNTDNGFVTTNADNLTAGIFKLRNVLKHLSAEYDIETTVGVRQAGQIASHGGGAWRVHKRGFKRPRREGCKIFRVR